MKTGIFIWLMILGLIPALSSQNLSLSQGTTRAVVIGISDYQSENISDLKYAHKDAEAFAVYLQSPSGGSLPKGNIKLLTNAQATTGQMYAAFDWLSEESESGDRAIIYFSGHGDVETKTRRQDGFLLSYDSPPNNYRAGAFALYFLQGIIETISLDKNCQVIVISDACRAGKLAGSDMGGPGFTSSIMAKQFSNEIKILSCQPNEFSIEGEQWGGGRGCFSYHLIDGLYGMADNNGNLKVNLLELGRYLEEKVSNEADPHNQIPMVVGNKSNWLATVDENYLAQLMAERKKQPQSLSFIDSKGYEEGFLSNLDSTIAKKYKAFTVALEKGQLLEPKGKSAYDLYTELSQEPSIHVLRGVMKRNLAAALQDESQQTINAYLRADNEEIAARTRGVIKYRKFVHYLEKAAELLGPSHYMYSTLKAKQLYFDAVDIRVQTSGKISESKDSSTIWRNWRLEKLYKALEYEKNAAFIYNEIARTEYANDRSKSLPFLEIAIDLAPNWAVPYSNLSLIYKNLGDYLKADYYSRRAIELASEISYSYVHLGDLYYLQKKYELAEEMYKTAIKHSPRNNDHIDGLERFYINQNRFKEAENLWEQALFLDPINERATRNLAILFANQKNFQSALTLLDEKLDYHTNSWEYRYYYGVILHKAGYYEGAKPHLEYVIKNRPLNFNVGAGPAEILLGEVFLKTKKKEIADSLFQQIKAAIPEQLNPTLMNYLCRTYLGLGDLKAIQSTINKFSEENPTDEWVGYQAACVYSLAGLKTDAIKWLEKAILKGFDNYTLLQKEFDLINIRDSELFEDMMNKYFPEQVKE